MIKVMHVISTFGASGAERMLCALVSKMDPVQFHNEIVSLTDVLDLAGSVEAIGVRVRTLHMKTTVPNVLLVLRLAQWMRQSKPDVIHTWMYHSNLVGTVAACLAGRLPTVWAIHHGVLDPRVDKRRTFLVNRACALLSRQFPSRIVCCSEASQRIHKNLGYAAEKLEVIPNGFDLQQVKPDPMARTSVREELRVPPETLLIGMAARFQRVEDHLNFIQAAARLHQRFPGVHFVLFGDGVTPDNRGLMLPIASAGVQSRFHLLGRRRDVIRLFSAMDIATFSSSSEAFPMAVGEAMACETPCVVTDVGDSARIVDATGRVVPPKNPDALAEAWGQLIDAGPEMRRDFGLAARRRVQLHFALPLIVERYQSLYDRSVSRTVPVPCASRP